MVEKLPLHIEGLSMEYLRFVRTFELPYVIKLVPLISLSSGLEIKLISIIYNLESSYE